MQNLNDIEKMYELKQKGILSDEEFEREKTKLLQQNNSGIKNQLAYCLLAFFLGCLGVHNFYAGRWKRGLTQLLITLLTFFAGSIFTYLWAIINIFTIHTDGKGNEFQPSPTGKYILGILGIIGYLCYTSVLLLIFSIAGTVGYTSAMEKYRAQELANYAMIVAIEAAINQPEHPVNCDSLSSTPMPEFFTGKCVVYPDGKVAFSEVEENLKKPLLNHHFVQEDNPDQFIFSFGP